MSEENQADPARIVIISQQIVTLLMNEDAETRRRAIHAALVVLGDSSTLGTISTPLKDTNLGQNNSSDLGVFITEAEKK